MRSLGKVFLQGLGAVLPVAVTVAILWWLGATAEHAFRALLLLFLPEDAYVPGAGVALGLIVVFAVGLMLRAWWMRALWSTVERRLEHLPLIKTIFGSIKDLMSFFAHGGDKRRLDQVVLLEIGSPPARVVGLLTSEDAQRITRRADEAGHVAVYVPMSYQIGGFMLIVPRDAVTPIDLSVEDALRTVVTAGLSGTAAADREQPR